MSSYAFYFSTKQGVLVVQEAGIAVVGGGADMCANILVGTAVAGGFQKSDVKLQMLLAG